MAAATMKKAKKRVKKEKKQQAIGLTASGHRVQARAIQSLPSFLKIKVVVVVWHKMTSRLAARCSRNSSPNNQSQGFSSSSPMRVYGFPFGQQGVCVCCGDQKRARWWWWWWWWWDASWHNNGTTQQMRWLGNEWTKQPWQPDANESHSLLVLHPFSSRLITCSCESA